MYQYQLPQSANTHGRAVHDDRTEVGRTGVAGHERRYGWMLERPFELHEDVLPHLLSRSVIQCFKTHKEGPGPIVKDNDLQKLCSTVL